jgi:ATP-dependent Clp protease ATP-binding subunit ClpA
MTALDKLGLDANLPTDHRLPRGSDELPRWHPGGMFERMTDRARRVLVLAQEEARLLDHSCIGPEHILLGLIDEREGVAAKAMEALGIDLEDVREGVREVVSPGGPGAPGSPPFTTAAKKVLELALREALQLGHNQVGTEHLLLGVVAEGESLACHILANRGPGLSRVRQMVMQLLTGQQGEAGRQPGASRSYQPLVTPWEAPGATVTIRVVRPGRMPTVYRQAHEELTGHLSRFGSTPKDDEVEVHGVRTPDGPGIALTFSRRLEDTPDPTP